MTHHLRQQRKLLHSSSLSRAARRPQTFRPPLPSGEVYSTGPLSIETENFRQKGTCFPLTDSRLREGERNSILVRYLETEGH
jgi:hypothetical protein